MINYSDITKAIEKYLRDNLPGYEIQRNPLSNDDPNLAARLKAWIGIYRGPVDYEAHTIGGKPWKVSVNPVIEIQAGSMGKRGKDAEDRLEAAIKEVMDLMNLNRQLSNDGDLGTANGTVAMTLGYSIDYEFKKENEIFWHRALITINAEVRA